MSTHPIRLLGAAVLALCALSACKREEPPAPKPAAEAPRPPVRTREQAIAAVLALPEAKAWSAQIEKASHGQAHGAVIEYNPGPQMHNGQPYYELTFVENHKDHTVRRQTFLVAGQSDEILVENDEDENGTIESLSEWRRSVKRVELNSK